MSDTQTSDATATSPEAAHEAAGDLDSRASALLEQLSSGAKAAPPATPVGGAEPKEKAIEAEPVDADPVVAARRERIKARDADIKKLAAEERSKVSAALAKKQERATEQVERTSVKDTLAITDAASFFAAAERLAIPPNELAAWLTGQGDPAKVAESSARKALTPIEAKLADLEAKQARWEESQRQLEEQRHTAALVEQNRKFLSAHLETVQGDAPLSARFHARNSAQFMRAVDSVCDGLPPGFTAQDVIDQLEENLSALQLHEPTSRQSGISTPKRTEKSAAVQANVGNRLAAERATTIDDDGEDAGSLDERAQKLKARLSATG